MAAVAAPESIEELLQRAGSLAGRTLADIANEQGLPLPDLSRSKGFIGQLLENCLGATAGNRAEPDFPHLGVELKTIPVDSSGSPLESTYVCTVPLQATGSWQQSWLYRKLQTILWIPVITDRNQEKAQSLIGNPLLWKMSDADAEILRRDWEELMELVTLGRFDELSAHYGQYLQVRPKAANASEKTVASNQQGEKVATNPRGFYLRTSLTRRILQDNYVISG